MFYFNYDYIIYLQQLICFYYRIIAIICEVVVVVDGEGYR